MDTRIIVLNIPHTPGFFTHSWDVVLNVFHSQSIFAHSTYIEISHFSETLIQTPVLLSGIFQTFPEHLQCLSMLVYCVSDILHLRVC